MVNLPIKDPVPIELGPGEKDMVVVRIDRTPLFVYAWCH